MKKQNQLYLLLLSIGAMVIILFAIGFIPSNPLPQSWTCIDWKNETTFGKMIINSENYGTEEIDLIEIDLPSTWKNQRKFSYTGLKSVKCKEGELTGFYPFYNPLLYSETLKLKCLVSERTCLQEGKNCRKEYFSYLPEKEKLSEKEYNILCGEIEIEFGLCETQTICEQTRDVK